MRAGARRSDEGQNPTPQIIRFGRICRAWSKQRGKEAHLKRIMNTRLRVWADFLTLIAVDDLDVLFSTPDLTHTSTCHGPWIKRGYFKLDFYISETRV